MKKTIMKLLSVLISLRYGLLAKQSFHDSRDPVRLRAKSLSISKALKLLSLSDDSGSRIFAEYLSWWLLLQSVLLAMSVYLLVCGRKLGLYVMVTLTLLRLVFENNPLAEYSFEVDRTEVMR